MEQIVKPGMNIGKRACCAERTPLMMNKAFHLKPCNGVLQIHEILTTRCSGFLCMQKEIPHMALQGDARKLPRQRLPEVPSAVRTL